MHSFDTGVSKGAKKNNWAILEKLFAKQGIPVTKDICQKVAMTKPKVANMVRLDIYSSSSQLFTGMFIGTRSKLSF